MGVIAILGIGMLIYHIIELFGERAVPTECQESGCTESPRIADNGMSFKQAV